MTTAYPHLQSGLTLVELLSSLAIFSIVFGVALPQFVELWERWKVQHTLQALQSSLLLARSEAIQRAGHIGIQKIDNEKNGCQNAGTNSEWGCGWVVYHDLDGNGSWNSKKDKLLQEIKLDGSVYVMHSSGGKTIKFDRYGMASGLNAKGFTLSPERTGIASAATATLCMGSGGRIRIVQDAGCT